MAHTTSKGTGFCDLTMPKQNLLHSLRFGEILIGPFQIRVWLTCLGLPLVQENYLNYIPSEASRDNTGLIHMDRAARAAMSIAEGDIVNGQIRRRNQWQLSQTSAFLSSVIP